MRRLADPARIAFLQGVDGPLKGPLPLTGRRPPAPPSWLLTPLRRSGAVFILRTRDFSCALIPQGRVKGHWMILSASGRLSRASRFVARRFRAEACSRAARAAFRRVLGQRRHRLRGRGLRHRHRRPAAARCLGSDARPRGRARLKRRRSRSHRGSQCAAVAWPKPHAVA
jgi:hypothetical protein